MADISNHERGIGPKPKQHGEREDPHGNRKPIPGFVQDVRITENYRIYQVAGFVIGGYDLTDDVVKRLKEIATELRLRDDQAGQITVIGTASDSRLQQLDMDRLALDRAELIASALRTLGVPGSIHAVSMGTIGAPPKTSDMVKKGLARGAYIHVRLHERAVTASEASVGFPAKIEEASLLDSAKRAAEKYGEGLIAGMKKGKVPLDPKALAKDFFKKVGYDVLADFSNHANAEKFGKECQSAFIETWANTMAHLMDDPRHQYRLALQRFVHSKPKPDIRALEAERLNLPRDQIYGQWQVGQFQLAGMYSAYDMVVRMRDFESTAAEWRRAYPAVEQRKRELIAKASEAARASPQRK